MLYNTIRLNLLQTLWNRIRIRINVSSGIVMILFIVLALGPLLVCCDRGTNIGCFRKPGSGDTNNMHLNIRADSVETCISNCEKLFYRYAVLDGSSCSCTHILSVEAVTPSDCDRLCPDKTQQFCGGNETESYYDTGLRNPGPVTNVKFKNITEDTISVSWNPPESSSLLVQYKVLAEVLETYSTRQLHNPEWSVSKEERQFDLVGLHPGTRYNISIISMGDSGTTDGTGLFSLPQWTEVGEPDNEPLEPKVLSADETSQIIEIYPVVNNNGPVSKYQLVVLFVTYGLMQTFDETQLRSYNESQELGMLYYIAAELDLGNNTRRIKIGDGRIYNGFYNAPLPPKSHIHVAVGVISTLNGVTKRRYGQTSHDQHSHLGEELFALDDESSNSVMVVVLSVFCVILAILLAASIAMFVYVRRHARANRKRLTEVHELHPQNGVAGGSHEMENSGFIGDELGVGDFKQQLQALFDRIPSHQLVPRNTLSLDIDNILGTGRFGDVIHGNLLRMNGVNQGSLGHSSQIHVISEDMEGPDQVLFLKELDQLLRIQPHPLFMTLLGICSTPDWMYIIFEDTGRTLKKRLIESRLPMDVDPNRMTSLSEEFVVRIMSNIADAMQYLGKNLIVHKQVCSYNVWMTASDEPKLSIFGPTLYIENRKLVDLARYQAPEVLRYQHHTLKSDVWSFACLAWECCTVGGTLYSNVISSDLLARIRTGSRPEQTPFIFNDLYQVLLNCWELDANDRMSMEEVAHSLRQMLQTSPKHVLSFDRHSGLTLPYYLPLLEIKNFDE